MISLSLSLFIQLYDSSFILIDEVSLVASGLCPDLLAVGSRGVREEGTVFIEKIQFVHACIRPECISNNSSFLPLATEIAQK